MSSELARNALDAAPDAMVIVDSSGIVCYANQQTSVLFGYPHDELVGRCVDELLPERLRQDHSGQPRAYWRNPRQRPLGAGLDLFALRRDGSEFPVEISLSPVQDGERTLVAAALRDVTDRQRAQAELIEARQLAEQARERADEARQSADRANGAKSRFLATASHDLRQPVQSLALLNGTLRRITTDADSLHVIGQQERAVGAMSHLLNALLDISRLESGAIRPDPSDFEVVSLFEELRLEFAEVAAGKGLQLCVETDGPGAVRSDRSLLEQILRNLLSNAIKYTRHGWVRLSSQSCGGLVRVEVLDTGVGIAPDQLPYICDEFYQIGGPGGRGDGYGLGLSIVQRLVSLLGMRLDVRSEVGKGSSFGLDLPGSGSAGASVEKSALPAMGPMLHQALPATPSVLLVEDEEAVRGAMRMLLRVEGYQVHEAASLEQALAAIEQYGAVDIVVTDYHLGAGQNGSHVIRMLRERLGAALPAVLTSGDTSSVLRELPHDPRLRLTSKPVKADELLAVLRELLTAPRAD